MDFLVVPTINFKLLYILLIISHDRRKVEYFAFTSNPSAQWVTQQIREATPFGAVPDYLIHPAFRKHKLEYPINKHSWIIYVQAACEKSSSFSKEFFNSLNSFKPIFVRSI